MYWKLVVLTVITSNLILSNIKSQTPTDCTQIEYCAQGKIVNNLVICSDNCANQQCPTLIDCGSGTTVRHSTIICDQGFPNQT